MEYVRAENELPLLQKMTGNKITELNPTLPCYRKLLHRPVTNAGIILRLINTFKPGYQSSTDKLRLDQARPHDITVQLVKRKPQCSNHMQA